MGACSGLIMRGAAVEIGTRSRELWRPRTGEDEEELARSFFNCFPAVARVFRLGSRESLN